MKFKKGDSVIVIAGKDKGAKGVISAVLPAIDKPMPIHASNVMIDQGGKPSKIGYKVDKKGKKVRIAKSTGAEI